MGFNHRGGFTLVETVLAIFVFAVGALGLAATTAVITRSLAESAIRERATRIGETRIEILRGLSCPLIAAGSESIQEITSSWTSAVAAGHATVTETVAYTLGGRQHSDSYSAGFRCQP
jgi:prepilin-type N-terminal cleavage/methylation domain-containing protein